MFFRHFFHEFRTAASDTRRVAWIPSTLVLVTFLIWQAPWSGRPTLAAAIDNETCRTVFSFYGDQWVWVGWLIPWFMLRYPSLHDASALWRSAPVGRWAVFGARLVWAFLSTTVLPVGISWFLCRKFFPVVATDQSITVFWIQSVLFFVGAFAAFSLRGRRGIWLTGALGVGWFIINLFGEDVMKWILHNWVLYYWKDHDYNPLASEYMGISRTWPAVVPWMIIPTLMIFWIPLKISRPGRESRMWRWIAVTCAVAVAAQGALFLTPYRTPDYPRTSLPLMKVNMRKSTASGPGFATIGWGEFMLPENDLRFIEDRTSGFTGEWRSAELISGTWRCDELSGRISPQLNGSRISMSGFWMEGEDGGIPDNRAYSFDSYVRPLRETFGVPGVKVWMARKIASWSYDSGGGKPVYEWADSDTFMQNPRKAAFSFWIPKLKSKADGPVKPLIDPKFSEGKTVTMQVKSRVYRALPPKIICRFSFSTGGVATTGAGETISILPGLPDEKGFLMRRVQRSVPIEKRPKPTDHNLVELPDWPELVLYNQKERQVVYLIPDMRWNLRTEYITAPEDPDAPFGSYDYQQYSWPVHAPKLTQEWFTDAEFILLEYKDEPVTLPLEFTLKLSAKK